MKLLHELSDVELDRYIDQALEDPGIAAHPETRTLLRNRPAARRLIRELLAERARVAEARQHH